jgi:peptide/nickel transport system ATP-binding protein
VKPLLSVNNLSIDIYAKSCILNAVNEISFNVYQGEIVGLVGESGSGKTLTALSIAGLLSGNIKTSAGSISYREKNLLASSEKELQEIRGKEIAIIFQEPFSSLNPLVKIGAQIAETLMLHSTFNQNKTGKNKKEIKRTVIEFMGKLGLAQPEKLYNAYPHQLSGGMCQRVVIAIALICSPRLLIADEPATALDVETQNQILALMKECNKNMGTAILFISHDLSVIKDFCDRVLVMYAGRIHEEGAPKELFSNPAHEYTRALLESIPSKEKKGKPLAAIAGKIPSLEERLQKGCQFFPRCKKAIPQCSEEFPSAKILAVSEVKSATNETILAASGIKSATNQTMLATGTNGINNSQITHITHCILQGQI